MKIAVGSDHRGFESKEMVKNIVTQFDHEVVDCGTTNNNPVDYPDMAYIAAKKVVSGEVDRAILICGSGIGMCIAANKVPGIRAALCHDELSAQISRDHNDANVLCTSGDLVGEVLLRKMVEIWLSTPFSGGRHQRRVDKIKAIEQGKDPKETTATAQ
jgi:ribose 5-phosphate isomerase B